MKKSTHDDRIRERILSWIASTGITQAEIARAIGRTQPWLSRYLRGKLSADFETLDQIARVFGHSLANLVDPPWSEAQHIERLRMLSPDGRVAVESMINHLIAAGSARARGRKR